jgi:hypothetical protein
VDLGAAGKPLGREPKPRGLLLHRRLSGTDTLTRMPILRAATRW